MFCKCCVASGCFEWNSFACVWGLFWSIFNQNMVLFLNINDIVVWWFVDPGGDYTATTTTQHVYNTLHLPGHDLVYCLRVYYT